MATTPALLCSHVFQKSVKVEFIMAATGNQSLSPSGKEKKTLPIITVSDNRDNTDNSVQPVDGQLRLINK